MPLTLERQNAYRARYARLRPGWEPATALYERLVRSELAAYTRPRLLDLGCGRGGVLEQLADVEGQRPVGLDPDFASLAAHRLPGLARVTAPSDAIPLRAGSVDLVISAWVLEHLVAPETTFEEVARVLRPGGAFIALAPNRNSPVTLLNRLFNPLQSVLVPRLYGRAEADTFPVAYHANTHGQLAQLAAGARLRLEAFHAVEDPTYLAFNAALFWLNSHVARLLPAAMAVHFVAVCRKL